MDALQERADELVRIAELLGAAVGGHGGLLAVEGPAGIGKTALVSAARDRAPELGLRVLAARGSPLERSYAWGVARQLLEPPLGAATVDALLRAADPGDRAFAAVHQLFWLLADLASERPCLVAVDDAQWVDGASLRLLAHLAARLDGLPVALLVAARPNEGSVAEEPLAMLLADPGPLLHPAPLSPAGVAALLAERTGHEPDADVAHVVCERTGGVPFLVAAVAGELVRLGIAPVAGERERIAGLAPRDLPRAVVARLRRLGPEALPVARALAVLGRGAPGPRLARLAGVERAVDGVIDDLTGAGILAPEPPIAFLHAIVEAAIAADIPPGERARLHRTAARLLADEGAASEAVASQLLDTPPAGDAFAVAALLEAGRDAHARGDPVAAIALLERALDEPPDPVSRPAVLAALGRAEAADGRPERCRDHLECALAAADAPHERARIALDLGRGLAAAGHIRPAIDVLVAAEGGDDRLRAELITLAANHLPSLPVALAEADTARRRFEAGDALEPPLLAALALVASAVPPAADAARLAERALDGGGLHAEPVSVVIGAAGNALLFAGRLGRAGAVYDEAIAAARRRGDRTVLALTLALRAQVSLQQADVTAAEDQAREADALYAEIAPSGTARAWARAHLLDALLAAGRLGEARDQLPRGGALAGGEPTYARCLWLAARGRVRVASGDRPGAENDLRAAATPAYPNPAMLSWRTDLARVLGGGDEAATLVAGALDAARAFGVPGAIGAALRVRAALEPRDAALATLREAVAVLSPAEARLEHAAALADLGAALRRSGARRQARRPLADALEPAVAGGAHALIERVRAELAAAGGRARTPLRRGLDALTPSERRVAALAAEGRSNREIAQALWVTPRTVESHLTQVYAKLGIVRRSQLSGALR